MKTDSIIGYFRNYQNAYERERGIRNTAIHQLHSTDDAKLWVLEKNVDMAGLAVLYKYHNDPRSWRFWFPSEHQVNYLAGFLASTYKVVDRANSEKNKALYQRLAEVTIRL